MAAARIGADGRLLRESVIGEGMRLITPAAPDPDTDSLVRFALANGFDDTAVRQLFGADMVASGAGRPGIGADGMPAAWVLAARGLMLSQGDAALAVAGESVGLTGQAVLDAAVGKAAAAMSALAETMLTEALPGSPDAAQPATDEPLSGEASADTDAAGLSGMTIRLPELARAGLQASAGAPGPGAPGVEAFEAAARRLADAVAQRLVADIRSGNWQVGFALDPPELGRVEVSLHMRGGELEARFAAQHGLARDLLQEALPRLREGLQQSGMDVAQLEVGLGLQARSGGNPTPGWRGSTGSAVAASADAGDGLDQIVAPVRGREDGTVDFWA